MPIESPLVPPPPAAGRRRLVVVVVVALAVLAVLGAIAGRSDAPVTGPMPRTPVTRPAVTDTRPSEPVSLRTTQAPPPPPSSARLQREFVEANDLYAFAENARRRPREGGILYAQAASSYCRFASERVERQIRESGDVAIAEPAAVDAHRTAVLERYSRRCSGFLQIDLSAYWRELDRTGAEDPLIEAGRALSRSAASGDAVGRLTATQALLDLQDPLLLSSKFAYLMNPDRVPGGPPGGLWFEGHDYRTVADEYGRYITALELAGCRSGAPCSTDALAIVSCRYRGVCLDAIDADPFADDPAIDVATRRRFWDDVQALTGRMRAALQRGDLGAFRSPPGTRQ